MEDSSVYLSDSQYEVLKQFKKNVSDILTPGYSDITLNKWLRARNYNLKKAEALFRQIHDCNEVYEFYTITEWFKRPEACEKYEYSSFLGFAKDGSLIRYIHVGRGDHYGFIMSMNAYDICKYCSYLIEWDRKEQKKHNEKTGLNVHDITYIFDMDNFSIQQLAYKCVIEMGLDLVRVVQDHFPECWGNVFFINAPFYFDKAFNIFKPIMKLKLLQKIRVVSREHTAAMLLKHIDEDVLPAFLGGKKHDSNGNPMCTEFLRFGGRVPEKYYLRNRPPLLATDPGAMAVWVAPRSVYNYCVVVREPRSRIRIEYRYENGSIDTKMLFRPFGQNPEELDLPATDEYLDENDPKCNVRFVSPAIRVQGHLAPVEDSCTAPWPGIYIFQFNNSYSWFTSRRIIFRIKSIPLES